MLHHPGKTTELSWFHLVAAADRGRMTAFRKLMDLQTSGGPRIASWVGADLSVVTTVVFVALLVVGN
jgi:hypothetical protein